MAITGAEQTYHILVHEPKTLPVCELHGCEDTECSSGKAQAMLNVSESLPFLDPNPEWELNIDQDILNAPRVGEESVIPGLPSRSHWPRTFKAVVSGMGVLFVILVIAVAGLVVVCRRLISAAKSRRNSTPDLCISTESNSKGWRENIRYLLSTVEKKGIRDSIRSGDVICESYMIESVHEAFSGDDQIVYNCHSVHRNQEVKKIIVFYAGKEEYCAAQNNFTPLNAQLRQFMPTLEREEVNEDRSILIRGCTSLPFMVLRTPNTLLDAPAQSGNDFGVLEILGQLSQTLKQVHAAGFVNRAVHVRNVFIYYHPQALVSLWTWTKACRVGSVGGLVEPDLCSCPEQHIAYEECLDLPASAAEDVYGMTAVLMLGLCGGLVWEGMDRDQVIEVIKDPSRPKPWSGPELEHKMGRYTLLIRWGLQYDPSQRPTAAEFEQTLAAVFSSSPSDRANLPERVRAHVPSSMPASTQSASSPPVDSIQEQLTSSIAREGVQNHSEHYQSVSAASEGQQQSSGCVDAVNPAPEISTANAYQAVGQVPVTSGLWSVTDSMLADVKIEFMAAQLSGRSVSSTVRRKTPVSIQQRLKRQVQRFQPRVLLSSQNGNSEGPSEEGPSAPLAPAATASANGSSPASSPQVTTRVREYVTVALDHSRGVSQSRPQGRRMAGRVLPQGGSANTLDDGGRADIDSSRRSEQNRTGIMLPKQRR